MEKYYLAVLSEYNHQEGFLELALQDLIESGLAIKGSDWNKKYLINILHDNLNNPYLLFKVANLKKVKSELKRRIIISEGAFKFENLDSFIRYVGKDKIKQIHTEIQEKYSSELLHTIRLD